jgi:hypothetical protein
MLTKVFPKSVDNVYLGNRFALWLIWPVVIMRAAQGFALFISGPGLLKEADGIPLDAFPSPASNAIFTMFLISATSRIVMSVIGVIVLVRYRSAFTLFACLLLLDLVLRQLVLHYYPLVKVGNPFGPITGWVFLVLTFVALTLSFLRNETSHDPK